MQPLPIDSILPEIVARLRSDRALVLAAPPGAGKTTRVPGALLDAGLAGTGEIVVLEPRRLAARMAAHRVAEELGEKVGKTVGYQVRFEDVCGPATRIRFVTEGVLARRLVAAPSLPGVAAVVLDEFHERHLQGDFALALLQRLRRVRTDLRVVVMSATLDTGPLAAYLGAPVLRAEGRRFDVAIDYATAVDDRPLALQVASATRQLVAEGLSGDVLVFLPGAAEIRRARDACEKIAAEAKMAVVPLHGDLTPQEQDTAVRPSDRPRLILSTNVAESSITIEGVAAVVDSGLARVASQSPWSGLPRLRVEKISRASADQRAGRAGRTRAGRCLRLYTRADYDLRPEHDAPEIRRLDLTQSRLEIAAMDAGEPPWLEAPPPAHVQAAADLLRRLGALDAGLRITDTGRRMLRFAVHPRAARVIVEGERRGIPEEACLAAALLTEGDPRTASGARFSDARAEHDATDRSDLAPLLDLLHEARASRHSPGPMRSAGLDAGRTRAVDRAALHLSRGTRDAPQGARDPERDRDREEALCLALLTGYPDRVAKRVRPPGRALALAGGGSAELSEASVVRDAEWMVALDAEERAGAPGAPAFDRTRRSGGVLVRWASAVDPEWLLHLYGGEVETHRDVLWDAAKERTLTRESLSWDGLTLVASEACIPSDEASRVLADHVLAASPSALSVRAGLDGWLARARFAASVDAAIAIPEDAAVRQAVVRLCAGRCSFDELREIGLLEGLRAELSGASAVDRLAPTRVALPSGRSMAIDYETGKPPSGASRIQDFFGLREGPRVGSGRVAVVLSLLAPNGRAVQVTSDLAGFWQRHYPAVRKELSRRYPRHPWPEDPTVAPPPRTTRR
jgi:ATP-dependent RNA helicase HrpB